MNRIYLLSTVGTAVAFVAVAAWAQTSGDATPDALAAPEAEASVATLTQGKDIYAANCASCHGAKLEGQPDWRRRLENGRMPAPPHDESGHTWHHADSDLFTITKLGLSAVVPGYESDMPAFGNILSDTEITAVLDYIKSTWPDRQGDFQAEVTANDEQGS
ncbi:c-type cytochrome [Loktanella sp. DJP18]|uniref:c-type cytochrome n=1 Tax=Loktanella sp. DJP18 TaxID=3409788 RepID=UPI003BB488B6